jgi:hypothetical protein
VERSLGGHPGLEHALADELDVARDRPREPVVEHGHGDVLDRCVDAERQRGRGRRTQDRRLAHEAQQVGDVAAAGALDVVGVDRPAGDRGHRVLELRRLLEPVGVEAQRQVPRLDVSQHVIDELGVGAVVLVDLEPQRARVDQRVEVPVLGRPRPRLHPDVQRPALEPGQRPLHRERRLLEPRRDQRGHAG